MRLVSGLPAALVCVLVLSSILAATALMPVRAQSTTTLGIFSPDSLGPDLIDPLSTPGSVFSIDVIMTDAPPIVNATSGGVNGFDITVTYDSSVLKSTSAGYQTPPCNPPCLFDNPNSFQLSKRVGDSTELAVTIFNGVTTGSGTVYTITFQVAGVGFTPLTILDNATITGPVGGTPIILPRQVSSGSFDNRPSFALSITPGSGSIVAGGTVSTNVSVTTVAGPPQPVTLSVISGLPTGATASFSPPTGTFPFTSALSVTVPTGAASASYPILIRANCPSCALGTGFKADTAFTLTVGIADMAVVSIIPGQASATVGDSVVIGVGVKNQGTLDENFTVNVLGNGNLLASIPNARLSAHASQIENATWNTSGFSPGQYAISATIPPVPGEFSLADNTMSDGTITLASSFEITLGPISGTAVPGQSLSVTVNVRQLSGTSKPVSLSVTGLPAGVTGSFSPTSSPPSFTSTLSLSTSSTAASGRTQLTITATSTAQVETGRFELTVNLPPVASFALTPQSPTSGHQAQFDASQSSDPDGMVVSYHWDFGDGNTGTGKVASHTYQSGGTYTVTLVVTDNDGAQRTHSQTVTVVENVPSLVATLTTPVGLAGIGIGLALGVAGATIFVRRRKKRAV